MQGALRVSLKNNRIHRVILGRMVCSTSADKSQKSVRFRRKQNILYDNQAGPQILRSGHVYLTVKSRGSNSAPTVIVLRKTTLLESFFPSTTFLCGMFTKCRLLSPIRQGRAVLTRLKDGRRCLVLTIELRDRPHSWWHDIFFLEVEAVFNRAAVFT